MKTKVSKFVYWTPRIISILLILFLAMFSLDVFGNNYGFWETILALLMHNIPVFILIALLIIAWKHELVGAIAFFAAGTFYVLTIIINMLKAPFEWYMLSYSLIIAGPAFFIGILFFLGWKRKKKDKRNKRK